MKPLDKLAHSLMRLFPKISALILAALAAYSNSFSGAFVFDDLWNIVDSPAIRHLWPQIQCPLSCDPRTTFWGQPGRPLLGLSFAINYALGGLAVFGYHVVNLTIHLTNALLLFGLLRRTFALPVLREKFGDHALALTFAIALLWAVHPLQTAAVTYIVQRAESLASLFYLLTLYCVVRGVESGKSAGWYAGAVFACLLGMSTKEVMVTAPVVVLLYDWMFLAGSLTGALRRRRWLYVGLALTWVWLAYLVVSAGLLSDLNAGLEGPRGRADRWTYAATQPGVILYYLRLSVWPNPLVLDYVWAAAKGVGEIVPAALAIGILLGTTIWGLLTRRTWAFLGASFFLILSPTSSIVPLFDDYIFEHRMYLALAAILTGLVLAGYAVGRACVRRGWVPGAMVPVAGTALVVALATALGVLTFHRNKDYASELSIWRDTVEKVPRNARALNNLAKELVATGQVNDAIRLYRQALGLKRGYIEAHNNLGNALDAIGQADEAIGHYQEALRLAPGLGKAHYNWAVVLSKSGKTDEAIAHYREALRLTPSLAEAHNDLGVALARNGRVDEAIKHYRETQRLKPDFGKAFNNLGSAFAVNGQMHDAIQQYRQATRLEPKNLSSQINLANALAAIGQFAEAIVHYREALRLKPGLADVHHRWANALASMGETDAAMEQFRQALRIDPKDAEAQKNLDKLTALRK